MSNSIREITNDIRALETELREIQYLIDDQRTSDRDYEKAVLVAKEINDSLDDLTHELKYQQSLPTRGDTRGNDRYTKSSSAGSDLFRSGGGRGANNSYQSDMGRSDNIRLKNPKRRPTGGTSGGYIREASINDIAPARRPVGRAVKETVKLEDLDFGLNSIMPYILTEGVTTKIEVIDELKERILYGFAENVPHALMCEQFESKPTDQILDMVTSDSQNSEVVKHTMSVSEIYKTKTHIEKLDSTLLQILIDRSSLSVSCGLTKSVNVYINDYVCDILNDILMLNSINVLFKNMDDFTSLIAKLVDVKTVILKEVKDTIKDISVKVTGDQLSIVTTKPTIYGFDYLVGKFDELDVSCAQVTVDSNPVIINTLLDIAKTTDSNVFNINTSKGERLLVVVSNINKSAVIRKNYRTF